MNDETAAINGAMGLKKRKGAGQTPVCETLIVAGRIGKSVSKTEETLAERRDARVRVRVLGISFLRRFVAYVEIVALKCVAERRGRSVLRCCKYWLLVYCATLPSNEIDKKPQTKIMGSMMSRVAESRVQCRAMKS